MSQDNEMREVAWIVPMSIPAVMLPRPGDRYCGHEIETVHIKGLRRTWLARLLMRPQMCRVVVRYDVKGIVT